MHQDGPRQPADQRITDPDQLLLLAVFGVSALTVPRLGRGVLAARLGLQRADHAHFAGAGPRRALAARARPSQFLPSVPGISGYVLLYADQPPSQPLYLNVNVTPSPGPGTPTFEFMDIVNPSTNSKPASWAVLLTDGARLTHLANSGPKVHEQEVSGHAVTTGALAEASGQLLWGQVAPGAVEQFTGEPIDSYVSHDATQTAVALPDFDLGSVLNTDPATLSGITRYLGAPLTSPGGLSIGFDAFLRLPPQHPGHRFPRPCRPALP